MKLNFCTACAAPLTSQDSTEYVCTNGHQYWNEPHASTCVIIPDDSGRLLLAKRAVEPRRGTYIFPGGFVNFDETPYHAARREIREETGLDCGELTLLDVYNISYRENEASLSIVFLADNWQGDAEAGDDAAALAWKEIDFIDGDDFAWKFPGLAAELHRRLDQR